MKRKTILAILMVLFVALFLVSGFFLGRYYLKSLRQSSQLNELADLVAQAQTETVPVENIPQATDLPEEVSAYTTIIDPDTGTEMVILKEYAPIYKRNTDMVGWIKIKGTGINYPVMQTPDSPNFYLYQSFQKQWAEHGSIYVQENCDVFTPSDNLIIYGHRMKDGLMFYDLQEYKDFEFFKKHPIISFDTITEHRDYEILSVFLTTASEGAGFAYHEFVDAATDTEFKQFIATCKNLSLYNTDVTASYGDKLITLSTCEYSQTNGRLVVVAKQVVSADS